MSNPDVLLTSIVEKTEPSNSPGIVSVTSFMLSGERYAEAIVDAVSDAYAAEVSRTEIHERLNDLVGKQVTLLTMGSTMMGARLIAVREGKLFEGSRGLALLPKGKRKNGVSLDPDSVLDVREGYNRRAELAANVERIRGRFPQVQALTEERLRELPQATGDGRSADCSLAVFGTWHGPDGDVFGAVWLIAEYDPEDDICDGVLILGGYGESEHGSVYGKQLLQVGGEVVGFKPISFGAALALTNESYDDGLRFITERAA